MRGEYFKKMLIDNGGDDDMETDEEQIQLASDALKKEIYEALK